MYSENRAIRRLIGVGIFGGLTLLTSIVGSIVNVRGMQSWYDALEKPSFQPPGVAFGIAWTILYVMIAIAGVRVFLAPSSRDRTRALTLWFVQLALNFAWTPLFFGLQRPWLALADMVALIFVTGAFIRVARRVDSAASWMFLPYLLWLGFAATLNAEIIRLNPEWARSAMTVLNG
ncbi:MAG: tryptophan-rich sensory protein [Polyangiaceae bacterium]|nr:tryptophan-rich sensory protein [Polyangiaceae bacterium]